jgi:hypothetical protein
VGRGAVDLAAGTSNIEQHADALVDLHEVLRLAGQWDESGPPLREALALYEQKGDLVMASRLRARLEVPAS